MIADMKRLSIGTALAVVSLMLLPASAQAAPWHENCTKFNNKYPHGVGRNHAHDHTSGTPVTTFKHSTKLYRIAMNANSRLDGDQDGIACEKA
jgi:hypothetical protein